MAAMSGYAEAPIPVRWIAGSGNWSNPMNWDIGVVPQNSGDTTYAVVIDSPDPNVVVTLDMSVTLSSLTNAETLCVASGTRTLSATVFNLGYLSATGGTLRLAGSIVSNTGGVIEGKGGVVELTNTTVNGGVLRLTDNANSLIRFSGDMALHSVTWEDQGAGEFQVYRPQLGLWVMECRQDNDWSSMGGCGTA